MPNTVIVGSQWGDEGKAKVIDFLSKQSDVIIRFQGGANAGHTVVVGKSKFVFHMVPSGIMYPSKICIVSNGVVFDATQFLAEVDELAAANISIENRLFISSIAHMVIPVHKQIDQARETSLQSNKIGTTGRGIGPAYADKASRIGMRVGDILEWDQFCKKIRTLYEEKSQIAEKIYNFKFTVGVDEIIEQYKTIRTRIAPLIIDTAPYLFQCIQEKKSLLFEGAQGTFLDIDHGTYPYVTSSNTIAGGACTGAGVGPSAINHVVGIVKAYTTRVGNGPFPTELLDSMGEYIRAQGGEFGATTGRPRRCGWFDSVLLRTAIQLNGMTRLALTKIDVLNSLDEIKICTHYELRGKKIESVPSITSEFEKVLPIYESHPGWKCDLSGCTSFSDFPVNARKYIERLQQLCYNVPLLLISIGPERNQTIEVTPL